MTKNLVPKKKTLEVVTVSGKTLKLDITEEGIKKVCTEQGFPVVKHGEKINIVHKDCSCPCDDNEAIIVGVGIMPCENKKECLGECIVKNGNGMVLWLSRENNCTNVSFIDPNDSTFKAL